MATILVIDDDKDLRNVIQELLSMDGHNIVVAEDGFQGLEQYHAQQPDLIISDLNMPRVNGVEMLESLAAEFTHVPIIVITGSDDMDTIKEVLGLKANRILRKPFESDMLLNAVGLLTGQIETLPTEETETH